MITYTKYAQLTGRLVILGFGSIGQAVLPLVRRHLDLPPNRIEIITADSGGADIAEEYGVGFRIQPLGEHNYREVLEPLLTEGSFLLNLSVGLSTKALIEFCQACGAHYLDTCIERWAGDPANALRSTSDRSNYALREEALALRRLHNGGPTAVLTMGANPGLASLFVHEALLRMAADAGIEPSRRLEAIDWAELARSLDIKTIHIAEHDTQVAAARRKQSDEFVNTRSVAGLLSEGLQPAELGWGTHERHWPDDAERHGSGCGTAIYLKRPGAGTKVRSWTPLGGAYHGFLITHCESISISDHLTIREAGQVVYRPTVHYAYHPCDDAVLSLHELSGRVWKPQSRRRIVRDDVTSGTDELGVLLMGNERGVYWFGSRLSIEEARALAPHNNATSLQVVAGILAGMVWAIQHPDLGIVEPDDLDYDSVMRIAGPYLGEVVGVYGDWSPLAGRGQPFAEDVDHNDPWQFKNMRVS